MKARISIAIFLLCLSELAHAGPSCNRTYEFIGLSRGTSDVFWIQSFSDGHCQDLRLHALVISGDTLDGPRSRELSLIGVSSAKHIAAIFDRETPIALVAPTRDWIRLDSSFSIRCPTTPEKLREDYRKWSREVGLGGFFWNRSCGPDGVIIPQSSEESLFLIAIDSSGLYLDYTIDKVFYFPTLGYLLVLTNNPVYHGEFDSENGFLLLRRNR